MRKLLSFICAAAILSGVESAGAQSIFAGTWRPDPQRPDPSSPPDVFKLAGGSYTCGSCQPPYTVRADGTPQHIENPRYDSIAISAPDAHSLVKKATRGGTTVMESTVRISEDGKSKAEHQTIYGMGPHPIEMLVNAKRLADGPKGTHLISGEWRVTDADMVHHDEDTTYAVNGDVITMTDKLGRSFTAKTDGTQAPYQGDPRFTSVSLKLIDSHTLEESDFSGGAVVFVTRWTIDPDGTTMHARFDDQHGHIQQQTGHKVP